MDFIAAKDILHKKKLQASEIIDIEMNFPNQVFHTLFSKFVFFHFDDLFSEVFFERIKSFLEKNQEQKFTFLVLEPNPETYFFHHFGKYPLFEIFTNNHFNDYFEILEKDPGESSADAILYNSTEVILFGEKLNWAVYGNRDYELAVFASQNENSSDLFSTIYGNENLLNDKKSLRDVLQLALLGKETVDNTLKIVIENYSL